MGKFCGTENSADGHHPGTQPILSPGNRLTLIFQTDDNNPEHQSLGFSAQYQAIGSTHPLFVNNSGTSLLNPLLYLSHYQTLMNVLHQNLQMAQVLSALRSASTPLARTFALATMASSFAQTSELVCVSILQIHAKIMKCSVKLV